MTRKTAIELSESEISQLRGHLKKFRSWLSQSDFENATQRINISYKKKVNIEITGEKDFLRCTNNCPDGCRGFDNENLFVCQYLPKELQTVERTRRAVVSKKVGGFTYKQQANKSGKLYWYIQFTFKGKTKTIYLGSSEPCFIPERDIEKVQLRKKEKENNQAMVRAVASAAHYRT